MPTPSPRIRHSSTGRSGLSRRNFLKFGGALGVAMTLPLDALNGQRVALGLMLPEGADAVREGLALYFAQAGRPAALWTVTTPARRADVLSAAQGLLDAGAAGVVAMLSDTLIAPLAAHFAERDRPLVVATAGENIQRDTFTHVSYASLAYWQAAYQAGNEAARTHGLRAGMIASLYEGGFDTPYAFTRGFEAAGGQIVATEITHNPASQTSPADALRALAAADINVLYAAYSGPAALDFAAAYADQRASAPLVVSPFIGEAARARLSEALMVTPWAGDAVSAFADAYASRTGRAADVSAWLGYLAGTQAARALLTPYADNSLAPLFRAAGGAVEALAALDTPMLAEALTAGSVKTGWTMAYTLA